MHLVKHLMITFMSSEHDVGRLLIFDEMGIHRLLLVICAQMQSCQAYAPYKLVSEAFIFYPVYTQCSTLIRSWEHLVHEAPYLTK